MSQLLEYENSLRKEHDRLTSTYQAAQAVAAEAGSKLKAAKEELQKFRSTHGVVLNALDKVVTTEDQAE